MPLGLDPDATYPVWLVTDEAKPEASRPTFLFRFLPDRKLSRVFQLREQASKEDDNEKAKALVREALAIGLAGWRNMAGIPFSTDAIPDVLLVEEQWELLNVFPSKARLRADELFQSGLLARSAKAQSASTAPAENVQASPAPLNP